MIDCLRAKFPRFADQLTSGLGDPIEEVQSPVSDEEIRSLESSLGILLPESYKALLHCARGFSLLSGTIRFGPDFPFLHEFSPLDQLTPMQLESVARKGDLWPPPSQGMLCFADFFLDADGDQLLFDFEHGLVGGEYPVMYYAHEGHPPAVRKLADSLSEFLDDCFSYFDKLVGT